MTEITLAQLLQKAKDSPSAKIVMRNLYLADAASPYEEFVDIIEEALVWISFELARNPELRQDLSEDQITAEVVSMLRLLTLAASHDTKIGGHCDVTIEAQQNLIWMAEAKMITATDNNWLYEGFQQLTTRYSTGNPNQSNGGLLIYCFMPRIDKVAESWEKYLKAKNSKIIITSFDKSDDAFYSSHPHERTGRTYKVLHLPISLYFKPLA